MNDSNDIVFEIKQSSFNLSIKNHIKELINEKLDIIYKTKPTIVNVYNINQELIECNRKLDDPKSTLGLIWYICLDSSWDNKDNNFGVSGWSQNILLCKINDIYYGGHCSLFNPHDNIIMRNIVIIDNILYGIKC